MIELPEALVLANQINRTVSKKKIIKVIAAHTPHKFVWYHGNPQDYDELLRGNVIGVANGYGGMVEIKSGSATILIGDGVGLRYHEPSEKYPQRHQLLIEFDDSSAISATVQMYGGMWCFKNGEFENPYYKVAKEKISPLSREFNEKYFGDLISMPNVEKLSTKAFLATGQRIPGLGNGVLQDILWSAQIHPKRKISTLSDENKRQLFHSVKTVLLEMVKLNGRDTEKDLFGNSGHYKMNMSKKNVGLHCPVCNGVITKDSYMGGSIYFCDRCQIVKH